MYKGQFAKLIVSPAWPLKTSFALKLVPDVGRHPEEAPDGVPSRLHLLVRVRLDRDLLGPDPHLERRPWDEVRSVRGDPHDVPTGEQRARDPAVLLLELAVEQVRGAEEACHVLRLRVLVDVLRW